MPKIKKLSGNFDIDVYLTKILPQPWLKYLPKPISHFLGYRSDTPKKRADAIIWLWTWIGAFCSISVIEAVFQRNPYFSDRGVPIIVGSFGATAVLAYGAIEAPFAQPRAIFFGHTFSAIAGVIITKLFETNESRFLYLRWLAGAICCATAAVVMTITKTIHPPAGATAMIAATQVEITSLGWYYIPVVMLSAALAVGVGLITNNIQRRWPVFWVVPNKIPERRRAGQEGPGEEVKRTRRSSEMSPAPEREVSTSPTLSPGEVDAARSKAGKMEDEKNVVFVTGTNIILPDFLDLEEENLEVLEEIQRLIREHLNGNAGVDGRTVTGENAV